MVLALGFLRAYVKLFARLLSTESLSEAAGSAAELTYVAFGRIPQHMGLTRGQ